jgi:predicted alpha/beta hydrolase family esterase
MATLKKMLEKPKRHIHFFEILTKVSFNDNYRKVESFNTYNSEANAGFSQVTYEGHIRRPFFMG